MSNIHRTVMALIIIAILSQTGCLFSKRNVYTEPPARTVSLDSVVSDAGPYRMKPPPDSFMLNFNVPDSNGCKVIIDLLSSQHKVTRKLIDSVYSAGWHKLFWPYRDPKETPIEKYRSYYYKITICDSTYTKSFYYRPEYY